MVSNFHNVPMTYALLGISEESGNKRKICDLTGRTIKSSHTDAENVGTHGISSPLIEAEAFLDNRNHAVNRYHRSREVNDIPHDSKS